MAIDFTRYQPPGVYTESVGGPQLSVRSSVPTAVAIFGQTVGYKTFRESLKINPDTDAVTTVQTITITGGPASGSFTLTFSGQTTSAIQYNATATDVQAALLALSNLAPGDVIVSGNAGGPYTATFPAAVTDMSATASFAGGSTPTVLIASEALGTPALNRTLTQQGIKTDTVVVVDPNSGQQYVVGTDYVITRISVGDDSEQGTRDDTYTLQRVIDGGHIDAGDTVQLSYQYTDPTYFEVYSLYDYDDVRDFYGEPFDAAGNIQSELSLAASFAFTNGASTVLTCAVDPANPDNVTMGDYSDALDKFRDEEQIAIIVPATGASAIQALVQQHVTAQSNNRYERRAIMGIDGSVAPVLSATRIAQAEALFDQRCALISPSSFQYYAPELNTQVVLGGQFMAAAVAGLSSSMIAAMPLTRKIVRGFVGPNENQREGEKNLESQNGLMVVEKTRLQQVQVRHGVTTNPTDILSREWSIIGQQDVMVYRIRDYLDADGLIGMPIYDTTLIQVKASAESALQSLLDGEIIAGYQNLKVRQIGNMPDVIEVRFEWLPAYPLNYIVVRYSVQTLTGDITIDGTNTTTV
jgi:hypothetical protein